MVTVWDEPTDTLMTMTLEEYVKGVVAAEMPVSFSMEALKAQAIAARTYAYRRITRGERIPEHPAAHLSTDYRSGQAWASWEELRQRWGLAAYFGNRRRISSAVMATSGVVAFYGDEPLLAVYHSTSGGRTEASENYWAAALPYLRSVPDPYSSHSPWTYTTTTIPLPDLARLMGVTTPEPLRVVDRHPSGRVKTFEVGDMWFSGREARQRLGLRSSWFAIESVDEGIQFEVWGYGHGVGLSQYGADGMARQGYDHIEILKYYYHGITLKNLY